MSVSCCLGRCCKYTKTVDDIHKHNKKRKKEDSFFLFQMSVAIFYFLDWPTNNIDLVGITGLDHPIFMYVFISCHFLDLAHLQLT